jgi:Tol biopolymer transport system component
MRALSHPFRVTRQVPIWIGVFVAAAALGVSVLALKGKFSRSGRDANNAMPVVTTTETAPETATPATSYKLHLLCFSRGDDIYLMDVNNCRVRKILKGDGPNISPDGERIAFVLADRGLLKTVDAKSGEVKEFASLQTVKAKAPQWSPDGSKIAFEFRKELTWRIAILDIATEQWHDITASYPAEQDYFLSSWTTKGQSLLIQDLQRVYEVDLHGKELQHIDVKKLLKQGESISSASRFSFSADKRHLLFNTALDPDQSTIIYKLDLKTSALDRLTPSTVDGGEPHWLASEKEILFSQLTDNKAPYVYSISKLSLEKGDAPEILVRDASNISYAPR